MAVGVVVAIVHIGLWMFLRTGDGLSSRTADRRTMTVTLIPQAAPTRSASEQPSLAPVQATPRLARGRVEEPRPISTSPMISSLDRGLAAAGPASAPASAPASEQPLDLTLRSAEAIRSRNPALGQGRISSERRGWDQAFGSALRPSDTMTIEHPSHGTERVRKGDDCYEVAQSRNAQLDPYAVAPTAHTMSCGQ